MPTRERYQKNIERSREYSRTYQRKWRAENPLHDKEYINAYMQEYSKKPEVRLKNLARQQVNSLIRGGKLERGTCEVANCADIGQAHHEDYSKPLNVR